MANRNTTRAFFVSEDGSRLTMDINDQRTVGDVKEKVRKALRLGVDELLTGSETHERKTLTLSYAGATLDDSWRFADLGIPPGAQVRLFVSIFVESSTYQARSHISNGDRFPQISGLFQGLKIRVPSGWLSGETSIFKIVTTDDVTLWSKLEST